MSFKDLEAQYKKKQLAWKTSIRMKPTKWKRFWNWVWYLIAFPWVWIITNIRDWRTAVIFVTVFLVLSIEVWLPYLLALIFWSNETARNTFIGVGSACWLFWAGPGTPFLLICIFVTIGVKGIFNKIKYGRKDK